MLSDIATIDPAWIIVVVLLVAAFGMWLADRF